MHLIIHRGTHEIGGSCVELQTGTARILIDFGLPLSDEYRSDDVRKKTKQQLLREGLLPDIGGLYDSPAFDAILISHAHQDHYGLLSFVHPDIPIYMSRGTKELINVSYTFNQSNCNLKNIRAVDSWKPFAVKGVKITPYLVDHSGFDALAFLIEADGKRLFYTGDFRGHGRKEVLFDTIIKRPIKNIDFLIMEGTMLSREGEECRTEKDIEREMTALLKSTGKLTLLSCSSQNIDRIVTAYRACMKTDTLLVLDPYTAYVLFTLKDIAKGVPQYDWDGKIRIFFIPNKYTGKVLKEKGMYQFGKAKITKDEVFSLKHKMLIKDSFTMRSILRNKKLLAGSTLIYSQWEGYFRKQEDFWKENNVEVVKLHASGHAYLRDLVKFVNALKPKNIIPIHTENADKYGEHFEANIVALKDGEKCSL